MSTSWHEQFRQRLRRSAPPAAERGEGLELRPAAGVPVTVWENVSHEQMLTEVTTNANPAAVAESAQEWLRIGDELRQHERALTRAIEESRSDWRGAGGDAVRRHLTEVAHWLGTTARGALLAGRQQQLHAQALEEARRRMAANPPVGFSAEAANVRLQGITDPLEYARQLSEDTRLRQAQDAAHAEAVRIMTEFDHALTQAAVTPFFAAPPELPGVAVRSGLAVRGGAVTGGPGRPVEGLGAGSSVAAGFGAEGPGPRPLVPPVPLPDSTGVSGVPSGQPAAVAGVAPVPHGSGEGDRSFLRPDASVGREVPVLPQSGSVEGDRSFSRSDAVAGGVPPLPQPGSAGEGDRSFSRADAPVGREVPVLPQPGSVEGDRSFLRPDPAAGREVPPLPPPGAAAEGDRSFSRSDPGARSGIPPFPQPDSAAPQGVPPFRQPDAHLPGGPHPDSTAASGARFVPPIPAADPGVAGGVPPLLPPDPAAVTGTGGPNRVPSPGPAPSSAAGPGRVPPLSPGGSASRGRRPGIPGGGLGGAGLAPGNPERSGATRDMPTSGLTGSRDTPTGIPAGAFEGPPGNQPGTPPPLAGIPRTGGKPAEDEEHRVADYLEPDPELFAAEQPVVPPTLGDWRKNKKRRKKP